jgi:hypothetical protein
MKTLALNLVFGSGFTKKAWICIRIRFRWDDASGSLTLIVIRPFFAFYSYFSSFIIEVKQNYGVDLRCAGGVASFLAILSCIPGLESPETASATRTLRRSLVSAILIRGIQFIYRTSESLLGLLDTI